MRLLFCLVVSAFLITFPALAQEEERTAGMKQDAGKQTGDSSETYRQLNLFGDVFERVRAQYVEPVDDKKLIEAAINGMLTSLDPHSSYMDEEGFDEMQVQTKGEFGGLGIEVTQDSGLIKVVSPIDDTPAFRAGIQAGDYITMLDGESVMGLSLSDAVDKMRGKVGTSIKLTIAREGMTDPLEVSVTRDVIRIESVKHKTYQDSVGYIRITTFSQNTDEGLRKAVKDIKEKLGSRLIGYIVDLRNNPGGLLDQAIAVADDFLDKGEIVSTRGRNERDTKRDNATPGDIADGLPIVVLINGGSASASEIVSGALQDQRRAILLGTKSFGKGSVQTVIPLPGNGAMRLTTARYYTPSGRSIQAKGIEPDIKVEPAKIEQIGGPNMNLSEADLPHALDKDKAGAKDGKKDDSKADLPPVAAAAVEKGNKDAAGKSDKDGKKGKDDESDNGKIDDYQLSRAIDLLHGVSLYGGFSHMMSTPKTAPAPDSKGQDTGAQPAP